jgi:hypothetical protein
MATSRQRVSGVRVFLKKYWQQARKTIKGRFVVLATCLVGLALVQMVVIALLLLRASTDLDTIANGSIPSINAAQAMTQYIEDIDAKSADFLAAAGLTDVFPCQIAGTNQNLGNLRVHDCDQQTITAEIALANQKMYEAARNVTYPGERTAIERIIAGFEDYRADIAREQYEYALAKDPTDASDPHLQNAYQAYLAASTILHTKIAQPPTLGPNGQPVYNEPTVPDCTINGRVVSGSVWPLGSLEDNMACLSSINKAHLDAAYDDTVGFLGLALVLTVVCCLLFCLLLAFTTWRMAATTHRVVNLGLTLALLSGLILSVGLVTQFSSLGGRHGAFGQMVKDDYGSIYAAVLLNHVGNAANADESRWLIAVEFGDQSNIDHWQQDWDQNKAQVASLIAAAHANRTYPEEDQPLSDMDKYWAQYTSIDPQIRAAATDQSVPSPVTRLLNAERISTGISNEAFGNFADAVTRLSAANHAYYARTYATTTGGLSLFLTLSLVLFPVIGLVAAWGVARRLKEF